MNARLPASNPRPIGVGVRVAPLVLFAAAICE